MFTSLDRRRFLSAAAAAAIAGAPSARAQGKSITVLIWGTTWQLVMQGIAAEFTKQTGCAVELMTQTTSGESLAKLQAMQANPVVDVWFTTSSVADRAVKDDGLFVDLPAAAMPNLQQLIPGAATPRWAAAYAYPLGIIWRPDMVKQPISSWNDLWDPRFKNQIGVPAPSSYQARMLLVAAILGGGGIENIDPGFDRLKALSPNVAFWYTSDAQARKALAQGDISVLVGPPSGAKAVRDQGAAVTMISPKPAPLLFDVMTMVKGAKQDLAASFIDFVLNTASQEAIVTKMQNEPVNKATAVPAELKSEYPAPGDGVSFDEDVVNRNIDAWSDRFKQVVAQ